jgi:hypothetical protein
MHAQRARNAPETVNARQANGYGPSKTARKKIKSAAPGGNKDIYRSFGV